MHVLANRNAFKMNGLGNEIAVLDLRGSAATVSSGDARAIGAMPGLFFDQLMVIYDARGPDADARIEIFNIDGTRAEACGNGTRCVAAIVAGGRSDARLTFESDAGPLAVSRDGEFYTVDMGAPKLESAAIPLAQASDTARVALQPPVEGAPAHFSAVGMGNPHAVFFVDDVSAVDLATLGPAIETHPLFPNRVNASFAQIVSRDRIALRVWERGAGATRACGTAACATLVAAVRAGLSDRQARVTLPGGDLVIAWREADGHVLMTGPVEFEAEHRLDPALLPEARA